MSNERKKLTITLEQSCLQLPVAYLLPVRGALLELMIFVPRCIDAWRFAGEATTAIVRCSPSLAVQAKCLFPPRLRNSCYATTSFIQPRTPELVTDSSPGRPPVPRSLAPGFAAGILALAQCVRGTGPTLLLQECSEWLQGLDCNRVKATRPISWLCVTLTATKFLGPRPTSSR